MQGPLTDPITSLVLKIAIGAAVGWAAKKLTRSSSNSPYLLLGVAGALVGGKIADVLEVYVLGAGAGEDGPYPKMSEKTSISSKRLF